jgi:hypothetical protein
MKKTDGRSTNDNAKKYRLARQEQSLELINKSIEILKKTKQPINPSSIARIIQEFFPNEKGITSAGIRKNKTHMEFIQSAQQKETADTKPEYLFSSNPEETKEKYALALENKVLKRENKILKSYLSSDDVNISELREKQDNVESNIPLESVQILVKALIDLGECYIKNGALYLEKDGSLIFTKANMVTLNH